MDLPIAYNSYTFIFEICLCYRQPFAEREIFAHTLNLPMFWHNSYRLDPRVFIFWILLHTFFLLMRFTTTFTMVSFSSVRLSAIIKVSATRVLSPIRLEPSGL